MDLIEQYGYVRQLCTQDAGDAFYTSIIHDLEGVPANCSDLRNEAIAQLDRAMSVEAAHSEMSLNLWSAS